MEDQVVQCEEKNEARRCEICKEELRSESEVAPHMKKMHSDTKCDSCDNFDTDMKSHKKKFHSDVGEKGRKLIVKLQPETNQMLTEKYQSGKPFLKEDFLNVVREYFNMEESDIQNIISNDDTSRMQDTLLSYLLWPLGSIYEETDAEAYVDNINEEITNAKETLEKIQTTVLPDDKQLSTVLESSSLHIKSLIGIIQRFEQKLENIQRMNSLSLHIFGLIDSLLKDIRYQEDIVGANYSEETMDIKNVKTDEDDDEAPDELLNIVMDNYEGEEEDEDDDQMDGSEDEWIPDEDIKNIGLLVPEEENQTAAATSSKRVAKRKPGRKGRGRGGGGGVKKGTAATAAAACLHKCEFCEEEFDKIPKLRIHESSKHKDLVSKCDECGKVCKSRMALTLHRDCHKLIVCHVCGKTLKANSIKLHMRNLHTDEKYVPCHICGKEQKPSYLKNHINIVHKAERRYSCETCGFVFKQMTDLKKHIEAVHERAKITKCTYCEKVFLSARSINRHIREIHEGKRSHKCDICSKSFSQRSNLKIHINSVHQQLRLFKCEICNSSFTTLQSVQMHTKNVHKTTYGWSGRQKRQSKSS